MRTRPGQERRVTVREAGMPGLSAISVLAGVVAAYGTFAIVAAIAGAIAHRADANTDFRTNDWTGSGAAALLISAVVLFIAFLFGGYIAGRMARRRGVAHGISVFIVSIIVAAIAAGLVRLFSDDADIRRNLRSIGVPTTWDQVRSVAIVGVIVALAAMLVGAVLGGGLGDRWHGKLERRAADPAYGTDADARREVEARREAEAVREPAARQEAAYEWREADARRQAEGADEPVAASDDAEVGTAAHPGETTDPATFEGERREPVEPGIGSTLDETADEPETQRTQVGHSPGRHVPHD